VSRLRPLFLVLLVACEKVVAGTSKRARNASKRLGVNKTKFETMDVGSPPTGETWARVCREKSVQTRGEQFITKRVQRILIGAPDGPPSSIHHHEIARSRRHRLKIRRRTAK
jgi:hypothetical protein